jgi:hypothetical protein
MSFKPGDIIRGPTFGGLILAMIIMPRCDGEGYRLYILDDETGYWDPGSIQFLHTKRVSFYELAEAPNNEV